MVSVVEEIVKSESLRNVLAVFALGKGLPGLDMMFSRYRREVIVNGGFLRHIVSFLMRAL